MGVPATGKKVSVETIGIDRVVDGKVVEGWGELDMLGLLTTIGAMVPATVHRRAAASDQDHRGPLHRPVTTGTEGTDAMSAQTQTIIDRNKAIYRRFVEEVINNGERTTSSSELYDAGYVDHSRPPGRPEGLDGVRADPGHVPRRLPGPALHDRADGRRG